MTKKRSVMCVIVSVLKILSSFIYVFFIFRSAERGPVPDDPGQELENKKIIGKSFKVSEFSPCGVMLLSFLIG